MKEFFALCIATFICAVLSPIGTWAVESETTKSDVTITEAKFVSNESYAQQAVNSGRSSKESSSQPQVVDLGLSVKWADRNVGASAPEEYGDYFTWGETVPYYSSQDPLTWKSGKTGYSWASYKWCNGTYNSLTKYNTYSDYGTVDNNTVLDPEDDAASVNWGGSWRMSIDAEWTELRTECTWTWTTQNGVNGRLVTGPNGNSIFLPAAGYRSYTYLFDAGSYGYYWSSSLSSDYPSYAYNVYFYSYVVYRDNLFFRYEGRSVRPVTE